MKKKSSIKTILSEATDIESRLKKINETYVFDEYDDEGYEDEDPSMKHQMVQSEEGESEEERAMYANEVIQHEPIIAKIREISIEGLKKYSDHPTSALYAFMKKVFLEADKVLTEPEKK